MAAAEFGTMSLRNDANLIEYYKLSAVTAEVTTPGNDLTNNGTTPFNAGKFGNAADFGATNSTKYLSNGGDLSYAGGAYSYSLWVNVTTAPAADERDRLAMSGDSTSKNEISLDYIDGTGTKKAEFYRGKPGVGADFYQVNQIFTVGTWYHFAGTYDGATLRMYVDGVEIGTGLAASGSGSAATTEGFRVGADTGNTSLFSGVIDDLAIFSRALTAGEVSDIALGTRGGGLLMQALAFH